MRKILGLTEKLQSNTTSNKAKDSVYYEVSLDYEQFNFRDHGSLLKAMRIGKSDFSFYSQRYTLF